MVRELDKRIIVLMCFFKNHHIHLKYFYTKVAKGNVMNSSFSLAKKTLALASIGMLSIPAAADWIANGGVLLDRSNQIGLWFAFAPD